MMMTASPLSIVLRSVVPAAAFTLLLLAGCGTRSLEIRTDLPTYPYETRIAGATDIQVHRDKAVIHVLNHTVTSHRNVRMWLNERYSRNVDALPAGQTVTLRLETFLDEFGEPFRGGGFLSGELPEPVVKAEIELGNALVGLIVQLPREEQ